MVGSLARIRTEAIRHALDTEPSKALAARKLGCSPRSLRRWVEALPELERYRGRRCTLARPGPRELARLVLASRNHDALAVSMGVSVRTLRRWLAADRETVGQRRGR